jgi:CubicO group peptidase (beta-lactamase class C family)
MLAQQGKLSLDDDVRKYVPEVPDFGTPITLRHLLHHTSGLRDFLEMLEMKGWRTGGDVTTEKDILDTVSRQRTLNHRPGDEFVYTKPATCCWQLSSSALRVNLWTSSQRRIFLDRLG